ncbi:MAG: 1-deoxy-D-xylulose-5-phosphate reductoisomerase [Methylophilaceae bacterium]|jgi:1-deoxy-D-xylulose-5-phosphate reductoisomerase|nr:1-deoxy-D-xylulose-5-phosphate reductoisomerase [Methylophilaceae bacterium]
MKVISILGSTGSIGRSTLSVVDLHPEKFKIFALSGFNNNDLLLEQAIKFKPSFIVTKNLFSKKILMDKLKDTKLKTEVLYGDEGYTFIASHEKVTTVVAAITGSAGLISTIEAAKNGKQILLANKESMVMAGELINKICVENNSTLIPVDSEHNAIFQVLSKNSDSEEIKKIILTASGGPFRFHSLKNLQKVTVEEALNHPNWKMGKKISIDSATMMNKGLEVIEASHLFRLGIKKIEVVMHPQSIIHSFVEYIDGSSLSQMGSPDMRVPIAYALGYPNRITSGVEGVLLDKLSSLEFYKPDLKKFRCLDLCYQALAMGDAHCISLNASNEIAVEAFLSGKINFIQIPELIEKMLLKTEVMNVNSVEHILELDNYARDETNKILNKTL